MKIIISLFAFTLMFSGISTVQATPTQPIKIDFSGTFDGLVNGSGLNNGDAFSGSFMFDLQNPDNSNITPSSFEFGYNTQAQATLSFSSQSIYLQNIYLEVVDNFSLTAADITKHGFDSLISSGTYDFIGLSSDSDNAIFDSTTDDLTHGTEIGFFALFNPNSFDLSGMSTAALLTDLKSNPPNPLFTGLELIKMDNGSEIYHAAGTVTDASVSAVPLPAAFWLFTSAVAALGFRFRQRA